MYRKLVGAAMAVSVLGFQAARAADEPPPAAHWIPADVVAAVELSRPEALFDLALSPEMAETVADLPAYKTQASQPGFKQFQNVVEYLELQLGSDWQTGVRKLLGGGVTLAVTQDGAVTVIAESEDAKMLAQLHELFLGFAKAEAAKQDDTNRVASRKYKGVTVWTFGGDEAHAIVGNRLLLANKPQALKAMLDLRAEPNGESLASTAAGEAAKKIGDDGATVVAVVNIDKLGNNPGVQQALADNSNPLVSLLLADVAAGLRQSDWLAAGLGVSGKDLTLRVVADGKTDGSSKAAAFTRPVQPNGGVMPPLSVPRQIAGASLYRDLHAFYGAKDDLFPDRTSGLIFFENMMGIFFSGLDLTEEVLGETHPEVRLVVAEQQYSASVGTPRVQIPAFAAVFRLRDPEPFGEVVEEAWQKAIGLVNFTRGQEALPGLIIDRPVQGDTKFTVAYFRPPQDADADGVHLRYNFRPALAMPGEYLILSSTEDLARDLIDALQKEAAGPAKRIPRTHSLVQIDGARIASILAANRENLIRQNMVDDGHTREKAESDVDVLMSVMKYLNRVELSVTSNDGRTGAEARLELNVSPAERK